MLRYRRHDLTLRLGLPEHAAGTRLSHCFLLEPKIKGALEAKRSTSVFWGVLVGPAIHDTMRFVGLLCGASALAAPPGHQKPFGEHTPGKFGEHVEVRNAHPLVCCVRA
jgi:hypothetical protein